MCQNRLRTCDSCIWCGRCGQEPTRLSTCEDYSPVDDRDDFTYYEMVLAENAAEYADLVSEMEA